MSHDLEPMTTLDPDEWRAYKRATRNLKYRQRMEGKSDNLSQLVPSWLAAVERDDRTDRAMAIPQYAEIEKIHQ